MIKIQFHTILDSTNNIFNMIVYGVWFPVIALSLFFYHSLCPLVFFSSPSHSLLIRERLILCSCRQQELLALPDSQQKWSLHFSCLFPRSTPPLFTYPSLHLSPLSCGSELTYFSLQPPLLCPPCSLFSFISSLSQFKASLFFFTLFPSGTGNSVLA